MADSRPCGEPIRSSLVHSPGEQGVRRSPAMRFVVRSSIGLVVFGFNLLLTLKKIVPNFVQLGDCRLERGDKEPIAITSHESEATECLERMGNLKIKVDLEIFCEPSLDTRRDFACRWRRFCRADEMVCEHSFLAFLVLGSGD